MCALAGFGKTALLADWARRDPRPVTWLTLDDADNDPARFWRHAAAALDKLRPGSPNTSPRCLVVCSPPRSRRW